LLKPKNLIMKIKINQKLKNIQGGDIFQEGKPAFSLKDAISHALLNPVYQEINGQLQEKKESREEKWNKFIVWEKIVSQTEEVDLSIEDVVLVKKYIGEVLPTLTMGQSLRLIEEAEAKPKK
jgi:hypothetical protein